MKEKRKLYVSFILKNGIKYDIYPDVYLASSKENEPSFLNRVEKGIMMSFNQFRQELGSQDIIIEFKGYLQNRFTSIPMRDGFKVWSYDQKVELTENCNFVGVRNAGLYLKIMHEV